jgi:glycosyltransferase involved in cell wall biosynthesis
MLTSSRITSVSQNALMKVTLSTIGKFHSFDLARQLQNRKALTSIFTGYPRLKLKDEKLPKEKVKTFPWLQVPYMALPRTRQALGIKVLRQWEYLSSVSFDRYSATSLKDCNVFCGLSGSALLTGKVAKSRGIAYVCDRGSSHIRFMDETMREEYDRWDIPYSGIDARVIDREEAEYALADRITVPSGFVFDSFIRKGIPKEKLRVAPYGVDLHRFQPVAEPDPKFFNVLFVGNLSMRKGIGYLLQAFDRLEHPNKRLTLVGGISNEVARILKQHAIPNEKVILAGHIPQIRLKEVMSRSHVMVLPSIEEGLALVQAQAMACGCPLISSAHTGAMDLFDDGIEGFVVPIRNAAAITNRLQQLADDPALQKKMRSAALSKVRSLGGWDQYGDKMYAVFSELC